MTERKIEVRAVLTAYQKVLTHGERAGDAWRLDGLTARGDVDGYTVSLDDGVVTVRVLFHNQLDIEAPSGRALENFVQSVGKLNRSYDGQ